MIYYLLSVYDYNFLKITYISKNLQRAESLVSMINRIKLKYISLPRQIKASVWFLVCSFMQKGISTITTPIFTRLLSIDEYGRYSVFNSWLGIVSIFITLNLFSGVYDQGLIKFDNERNIFSSSLQGLTLTLTVIWTMIYIAFRSFWNSVFSLTSVQMLAMLIMIWSSAVFSFWATEQRVELNYVKLVIVTIIVSLAKPIIGIVFVINAEDKVTARILGLTLVELIGYFGLFISQMRRGKKFYIAKYWKYALCFNLPLIPHYLSQMILAGADRIMIRDMIGDGEAGIYSLAYSVSMMMKLFNTALSQTIGPWMYQKIKDGKAKDISSVAYASLVLVAVANILLIVFAPEIVAIFAPESYYDAIWVIPPVAMSVFFVFAYDLFAKFEFYYEKTKFIMTGSIVAAIANVVLNYIFIQIFGYYAAGYTTLFCYVIYAFAHYLFMKKVCKAYMDNEKVYEPQILIGIVIVFLALGFVFLLVYKLWILRYTIASVIIIIAIIKRNIIIDMIKMLLQKEKI